MGEHTHTRARLGSQYTYRPSRSTAVQSSVHAPPQPSACSHSATRHSACPSCPSQFSEMDFAMQRPEPGPEAQCLPCVPTFQCTQYCRAGPSNASTTIAPRVAVRHLHTLLVRSLRTRPATATTHTAHSTLCTRYYCASTRRTAALLTTPDPIAASARTVRAVQCPRCSV